MTFKEANLTFLCSKIYPDTFSREDMSEDINDFYNGWEPHWMFLGEVLAVDDRRES